MYSASSQPEVTAHPPHRFSIIASTNPSILTKRIALNDDGTTTATPAANMSRGMVRIEHPTSLREFNRMLDGIKPNEAATYGLPEREGLVVTDTELAAHTDAIARTEKCFKFDTGPGWLFLDSDAGIGIDELPGLLEVAIPALARAPIVWRQSASAGLMRTSDGVLINTLGKWHGYIPVADASRIKAAGEDLQTLLWSEMVVSEWVEPGGSTTPRDVALAWMRVNGAGRAEPRSLLDAAVHQASRLDFVAPAVLSGGLTRLDAGAFFFNEGAPPFDLNKIRVTPEQHSRAKANMSIARAAVREECERVRLAWLAERVPLLAAKRSMSVAQADGILRKTLDSATDDAPMVLPGDFLLLPRQGDWVSVHEVYTNRDKYPHGSQFADPLEPDYNNDRRIAWLNTMQARPTLYSHARGSLARYQLSPDREIVFAVAANDSVGYVPTALQETTAQLIASEPTAPPDADLVTVPTAVARTAVGLVTREEQVAMFSGYVGVLTGKGDSSWVLTPTGDALSKSQFDDAHGGREFTMGGAKQRSTRRASEAFFDHAEVVFPQAHAAGFRPQLPFQSLYKADGRTMVNTYRPLGQRREGDASPMVDHIRHLFPVGDDATILLSYLAAMVQYPGQKFTWCPVLQSGPGAGKGLIANAMFTALGVSYCKQLEEMDLKSQFNGWLEGSLMCYFPEMSRRVAMKAMERLKVLITDGRNQGVERKNKDKVSTDVCANFLFMTNYRDAVAKDANDRRFCVMYSAIQTTADLTKAGLGSAYFRTLRGWLADGGEAIFANWLHEYEIPEEYDPTKGAHVAPVTSSTARAIELGRSDIAEVIAEAIEDEKPGFKGGWLSWGMAKLYAVGRLTARNVTVDGLCLAIASLGFERCAALPEGKTDNPVLPDAKRATLYSRGIGDLGSKSKAEVARAYVQAQEAGQFGVQA